MLAIPKMVYVPETAIWGSIQACTSSISNTDPTQTKCSEEERILLVRQFIE